MMCSGLENALEKSATFTGKGNVFLKEILVVISTDIMPRVD